MSDAVEKLKPANGRLSSDGPGRVVRYLVESRRRRTRRREDWDADTWEEINRRIEDMRVRQGPKASRPRRSCGSCVRSTDDTDRSSS